MFRPLLMTGSLVLLSYVLGCFSTGYYLVRWRTGADIRTLGTGTAGARNAGRVLGRAGFILVFAGDALKGALAVWLAKQAGLPPWGVAAALVAVVLGHLFPFQLGWRGGKGAATALGGVFALYWVVALLCLGVAAVAFLFTRNTTLSGLVAFVLAPFLTLPLAMPVAYWMGVTAVALILLYAHRANIGELRQRISSRQQ
jgi:glycerol-3-phosphate acyltransferase PlsY